MRIDELAALWDSHIQDWMKGAASSDARLLGWQETYIGEGKGAVDFAAMPEPWIGDPKAAPGVVLMGMNPGSVNEEFQHRGMRFQAEINDRHARSWANWAKASPYLSEPWRSANGPNPYWITASSFVEAWASVPVSGAGTVCFVVVDGEVRKLTEEQVQNVVRESRPKAVSRRGRGPSARSPRAGPGIKKKSRREH